MKQVLLFGVLCLMSCTSIKSDANKNWSTESFAIAIGGCHPINDCLPYYQITIFPDGKVLYTGIANVKTKGEVPLPAISAESARKTLHHFYALRPKNTDDNKHNYDCANQATDQYSIHLTWQNLSTNQKTQFSHYMGCFSPKDKKTTTNLLKTYESFDVKSLVKLNPVSVKFSTSNCQQKCAEYELEIICRR